MNHILNVFDRIFSGISNVKSRESLVMSTEDDPFGAAPFSLAGEVLTVFLLYLFFKDNE